MAAIQKALLDFRNAYSRIPCPADAVYAVTYTTNYTDISGNTGNVG